MTYRHRRPDFPAGKARRHDDDVLQHEHRDEGGEAEVGPTRNAGNASTTPPVIAARHHLHNTDENGRLIEDLNYAGGIGSKAELGIVEVHFVGEAKQQVPGHRKRAEIVGDGEQARAWPET